MTSEEARLEGLTFHNDKKLKAKITKQDWKDFYKEDKARCMSVVEFEESSKLFKKYGYGLSAKPIRKILKLPMIGQTELEFDTKPCACIEDFCLQSEAV